MTDPHHPDGNPWSDDPLSGNPLPAESLVTVLRNAARSLIGGRAFTTVDATLNDLVRSAVETVPHADGGGISRTEIGTVRSSYATSDDIYRLDQLQAELEQGPCITAADHPPVSGIVLVHDLAGADARRWPSFAPGAVRAGYRSMMSVQLSLAGKRRSALNFYAHTADAFDTSDRLTASLFAVQAAMLLYGAERAEGLDRALTSRDVIGQAKGILMERFTLDDHSAFRMLVASSQEANMKLADVADWVARDVAERAKHAGGPRTS